MRDFFLSDRKGPYLLFLALCLILPAGAGHCGAEEPIILGDVEDVMILPWRITLPARIDTGAQTSSLDARDLVVKDGEAEFCLPEAFGGKRLRLLVVRDAKVKGAVGRQERPVVMMEVCIGRKRMTIEVTLADRSAMKHPLLIGRNVLEKGFLVDVARTRTAKPCCN